MGFLSSLFKALSGVSNTRTEKESIQDDFQFEIVATPATSRENSLAIEMTPEMIKEEENKYDSIYNLFNESLVKASFVRKESIPTLLELFKKHSGPGLHFSFDRLFKNDPSISLEDKKKLGLNTRKKYSSRLIEIIVFEELQDRCPKELLEGLYLNAWHKIHRQEELKRMKSVGVKQVRILDCGDERDCKKIKRAKKIFPIDEVPELPIEGCNASYCRCSYVMESF